MTTSPLVVLGPGAIGGLVAAMLDRGGRSVTVVGRPGTLAQVTEHGIAVESDRAGSWTAHPATAPDLPPGAAVIVAVKASGLADATSRLVAAPPSEVLTLLNGIEHVAALRAALPGTRVVGATIAGEVLRTSEPGPGPVVVRHRGHLLRIVAPADAADLVTVRALRDAAATVDLDVDAQGTQAEVTWRKLRFLAPHALLTSRAEAGLGDALARDPAMTDALLAEVAAVASAEGVPTTGAELRAIMDGFPATMRSSLQADVAAGDAGELDAIGGAVLRRGQARGLALPVLARVLDEVAAIAARGTR